MIQGETDKTASDIQARSFVASKLENARRLRGIYFIDLEDKEFKEIIQNARRKLETPMALQLCLARRKKTSMRKPVAKLMISSLNLHVSWKPVNPQECVWKNLYRNIMRTKKQEKGTIQTALQYGTQIHSCASSNEDARSKSSRRIKNGRNWKTFRRGT